MPPDKATKEPFDPKLKVAWNFERECLEREIVSVRIPAGTVRIKVARRNGTVLNAAPEFDDCVRLATASAVSVKEIQAAATKAWLDAQGT